MDVEKVKLQIII